MSRLEELIRELCPHGVEYKTLGEFATVSRGGNFQKKDFLGSGFPCIHYGQIYTRYGLFADNTFTFISEDRATKQKKASKNDIIMAVTSENIEDVCKCLAWLGEGEVAVSGHTAIIKHNQNPKYLVYYFHTEMFFAQKKKLAHGTKVIEVTPDKLLSIQVPVPPLEIQSEIVRILDNFTELTAELTAELTVELNKRKKQYEYYRDSLLDFNNNETGEKYSRCAGSLRELIKAYCPDGVEYIFLNEIAEYSRERIDASFVDKNNYVGVDNLLPGKSGVTISNYVPKEGKLTKYNEGDILIGNIRPYLRKIWCADHEGGTNGDVLAVHIFDDKIISRYLYYVLSSEKFFLYDMQNAKGAKMPRGDKKAVMKYSFPLPPLPVQQKIVSILDRFDALCNDLSSGLPAEIEARQKQYEYYRDKLLTFKPKKAAGASD